MDNHHSTTDNSANFLTVFDYSNLHQGLAWETHPNHHFYEQQTPASTTSSSQHWQSISSDGSQTQHFDSNYYPYHFDDRALSAALPVVWNEASASGTFDGFQATVPRVVDLDGSYSPFTAFPPPQNYSLSPDTLPAPLPEPSLCPEPRRASTFRSRLSYEARAVLDRWFDEHRSDPYLEKSEAEELAAETRLSVKQVRTYFANARARKMPPTPATECSGGTSSPVQEGTPRLQLDQEATDHAVKRRQRRVPHEPSNIAGQQQSPMERFLRSTPEEQGVSEDDVKSAVVSLDQSRRPSEANSNRSQKRKHGSWKTEARSDAGRNSDVASVSSHSSLDSTVHRGPRRGRKRQPENFRLPQTVAVVRAPPDPKKIFQCTFCAQDFSHKYDWRRHEESVHFPQQEWLCMPENNPTVLTATGAVHCAFCDLPDPTPAHLDSHNCSGCLAQPRSHRVFTRKDKLLQHIGQVHKQPNAPRHLSSWCRPVERNVAFGCGICGVRLSTWQERVDHISAHFAVGQDMRLWRSEPGNIRIVPDTADSKAQREVSVSPKTKYLAAPTATDFKPSSSVPLICSLGCDEHFHSATDLAFHERQAHGVYREAIFTSASPPGFTSLPPPPPPPPAFANPSHLIPSHATTYPDLTFPALATDPPALSYYPDLTSSNSSSSIDPAGLLVPTMELTHYDVKFEPSVYHHGLLPSDMPLSGGGVMDWGSRRGSAAFPGSSMDERRGSYST